MFYFVLVSVKIGPLLYEHPSLPWRFFCVRISTRVSLVCILIMCSSLAFALNFYLSASFSLGLFHSTSLNSFSQPFHFFPHQSL